MVLPVVHSLVDIITSKDDTIRNLSLNEVISQHLFLLDESKKEQQEHTQWLLHQCQLLDEFRRTESINLYERVRACFFLYAIHRYHLCMVGTSTSSTSDGDGGDIAIPYSGYQYLQNRQYDEAIDTFLQLVTTDTTTTTTTVETTTTSPISSVSISSSLAQSYYQLAFQLLANQVRVSVRQHPGNSWMYQDFEPKKQQQPNENNEQQQQQQQIDFPIEYHIRSEMLQQQQQAEQQTDYKCLKESTPVRMDLTHCGWSDIFFLGMDYPDGAKVINCSIDLVVRNEKNQLEQEQQIPVPPIDTFIQVIDESVLKLTSIDLQAETTLTTIQQVFDFGKDYLGLIKAGIIASGIVPLGLEHSNLPLSALFDVMIGKGKGLHVTTHVHDIPKGSRLAVSTNLLASIIAAGMRCTNQTQSLLGSLSEPERRLVAARAILGEWLGGSGGGWQDSGGVWPGIKIIQGVPASDPVLHPEYGISRGQLLPQHRQLDETEAPPGLYQLLQDHLILVHGGMAQNVGPILNMVTEKYLLREPKEWTARQECLTILDDILLALKNMDVQQLASATTRNFFGPLQTIIPWASNMYTETIIERTTNEFGKDFLGFWMLGGASGGGMGFIFKTKECKQIALKSLHSIMLQTKCEMETALPFAMDPVVYEFSINENGTYAQWVNNDNADTGSKGGGGGGAIPTITSTIAASTTKDDSGGVTGSSTENGTSTKEIKKTKKTLDEILIELDFDEKEHENIREIYRTGQIGVSQNRLPIDTQIEDVTTNDVIFADTKITEEIRQRGHNELKKGTVAVVTLAAGVGSRWTQGAGCVKAMNPFCRLNDKFRSFLEVHLAKTRQTSALTGTDVPHVITTSIMTNEALQTYLNRMDNFHYTGPLYVSLGKTMGIRLVPTIADLEYTYHHQNLSKLDEQAQKVRESGQHAMVEWARTTGEANDYRDNIPMQCLHPVGHFYEIPNLLLNGTLQKMLEDRPQLQYLMLHNVDTVGANVDPGLLGLFVEQDATLSFEVIPRQIQDVGGGLATVNGQVRMVEGLALPKEEDEFKFSYYNSMTTWIDINKLLIKFGLHRDDLKNTEKVANAVFSFARRLPTYVALKDVKKRWGNAQEDVYLTAQFEKLWSDMSALDDFMNHNETKYFVVSRYRGSQLKDVAQLDSWLRDGSAAYVESLCSW